MVGRVYGKKARRTVAALARIYGADRYVLDDDELGRVVAHSEAFYAALPARFRLVALIVLALFRWSSRLVAPRRRAFLDKSLAEQTRVYERWFAGDGYVALLLGQILHLTFAGSVYSLPRIQAAIGYRPKAP